MDCLELSFLLLQIKKDLSRHPLKEAFDDNTLPLCWKGQKPFKSVHDVRKYFKTLVLSFGNGRRKATMEIPPENYLIVTVCPPALLLAYGSDKKIVAFSL